MNRYTALAVLACLVVGGLWVREREALRVATEQRIRAEAVADDLQQLADSLAGVVQVRVDTALIHRTRWDTLKVAITETDTVTVERIVAVADSAINSCGLAVESCLQRSLVLEEANDSLQSALAFAKKAAEPCRVLGFIPCPELVVGLTINTAGVGLGATGGIPIR